MPSFESSVNIALVTALAASVVSPSLGCANSSRQSKADSRSDRAGASSVETEQAAARQGLFQGGGGDQAVARATADSSARARGDTNQKTETSQKNEQTSSSDRHLVKEARLRIDVTDARETVEAIQRLAERYDGYTEKSSGRRVVIRVEASRLEEAIEAILGLEQVEKVRSRSIESEDVTDQIRDYDIRLDNKLEARERYLELMKKAEDVEDMVGIEKELERLNGEIERLKGRLKRMKERVALSKITVSLRDRDDSTDDTTESGSVFTPGFGYALLNFTNADDVGLLHGPTMEIAPVSHRDLLAENAPSHWRLFVEFGLLTSTSGSSEPWLIWSGGFRMSLESAPAREWLIPNVGVEAGQLVTPEFPAGHLTPTAGLHVWSAENVVADLEGGYFIPPAALETRRGFRVDASVRFTFW